MYLNDLGINRKIIILFILLTTIFAFPLYGQGIPSGHDLIYHFSRIVGSFELLNKGIFPAKIMPGFYNNFGYPVGIFYPTGLLYIASFLMYISVDFVLSYKIFIIFISFITTVNMYIAVYGIFKSRIMASFSTVLYTLSIYRVFTDLYYRGAIGEYIAFAFIPIAFWGLHAIIYKQDKDGIVLACGMIGLISSHTLSTVLMIILLVAYTIFNFRELIDYKKGIIIILRTALFTLLIMCYYWLPMLEMMMSDVFQYQTPWTSLTLNILTDFRQLFYITPSISSFPFGYEIWLLLLIMGLVLIKFKTMIQSRVIKFSLIMFCVFYVFTSNVIPVKYLMFFNFIQFPWRVFIFITFFGAIIVAFGLSLVWTSKSKLIFVIVLVFTSINYLYAINYYFNIEMKDYKYLSFPRYSIEYFSAEFIPESANMDLLSSIDKSINVNNPIEYSYETDLLTYYIYFDQGTYQNTMLEVPLLYYKGYAAYYMSENESDFLEVSKSDKSLINIDLGSKKKGSIKLFYNGTRVQRISVYTSLLTLILIVVYRLIRRRK